MNVPYCISVLRITIPGLAGLLLMVPSASSQEGVDFFERKIRPVLVEHCYSCHSVAAKKEKGGLLLDTKKGLLSGGDNGPAIVPGKPNDSLLIKAIRYTDPDLKMPKKTKLPTEVIADFEKWVAMGAPDPRTGETKIIAHKYPTVEEGRKFWAFQPVKSPVIPKVKDATWARGDIDRFVLARLEDKQLRPSRDIEPTMLIRRLHFALIGLPPSPAEVDAFVKDYNATQHAALQRLVDRLLASPHFGERWGRHWLDVARFAESSGGGRTAIFKDAWRYRDYVIHSFNSDKPFAQFIIEQLSGDLLEAKTPEERYWQLVATAFLLLGPTNFERQDKPLLEMDVIDEQIDTMGKGFLGMTIGCARCHDHKFDPIPTKDYYALAGIFKSTKFIVHSNVSRWMERPLPAQTPELEVSVKKHEAAVAVLKSQIKIAKAKNPGLATDLVKGTPIAVKDLPGIVIDDADARKVGTWKHSVFSGQYIGEGYLYDDRAMKGEKTLTFQPEFTESGTYEVRLAYLGSTNRADKVAVRVFHRNGDDTIYVNQKLRAPIDGRFISLGRYRFTKGNQWFVMLSTDGANGHVVADAVQFLPEEIADKQLADKTPPATKQPLKTDKLNVAELEAQLKRLEATAPQRQLAMAVADGDKVADFYVCVRGIVHNKGETVKRGVLQVATPLGKTVSVGKSESGRRELAAWVASPDNPLTARVFVNRVWHHLMGVGLVRTVDNFGSTGETPSHPELLDYLAAKFSSPLPAGGEGPGVRGGYGWSVKKLIREIVLSHTYAMTSEPNADGLKADPENRLLWRMNRQRLSAEAIRDTVLTVSGQLDRTTLGNTIKKGTTAEREYVFDDVRRSVYTPIFRNRLLELFEVFDFPDPNMVMGRRNVSTVPTQALYMMNSSFIMTQANHAATVTLKQGMKEEERIDLAYRQALGRLPTPRERELALAYVSAGTTAEQRLQAWERFYQTLFACVDFRYVN